MFSKSSGPSAYGGEHGDDEDVARTCHGLSSRRALRRPVVLRRADAERLVSLAELHPMRIDAAECASLDARLLSSGQIDAVKALAGRSFAHKWQLADALAAATDAWKPKPETRLNKAHNKAKHSTNTNNRGEAKNGVSSLFINQHHHRPQYHHHQDHRPQYHRLEQVVRQ